MYKPEAAEKPSSSDRPREQDISIQKPKQDISVQKPKQDIGVQKPKQDISVQKPKQDISVQKSPVKTNSPVQEPRRSGRNIKKPERLIEQA